MPCAQKPLRISGDRGGYPTKKNIETRKRSGMKATAQPSCPARFFVSLLSVMIHKEWKYFEFTIPYNKVHVVKIK